MEWISVKERLPENSDGLCLIKLKRKCQWEIFVAKYCDNLSTNKKDYGNLFIVPVPNGIKLENDSWMQFYFEKRKVSHWMPLPSAPKD